MTCHKMYFGGSVAYVSMCDDYKIRAGEKEFCFSFHSFCGPSLLGKRGQEIAFPPQKSPFWDALYWWIKQGKQVDSDGYCVFKWETKPVNILKHLGGRNWKVLA